MFASIDGRITTGPNRNVAEWTKLGLDANANDVAHKLFDDLDCDGVASGSETLMVFGNHAVHLPNGVYWPKKSKAFIVFDGRGRIEWGQSEGLLVVTREDVSPAYLDQLSRKRIRHIRVSGEEHIDLETALARLYEQGFRRLGLSGGGTLNGAFLRQGLIDEISIVYAPVAIGGKTTPTVFDGDDLADPAMMTGLDLIQTKPLSSQLVWAHYRVKKG
jgi:riboflavin biosynthesis pyrimidine reductase